MQPPVASFEDPGHGVLEPKDGAFYYFDNMTGLAEARTNNHEIWPDRAYPGDRAEPTDFDRGRDAPHAGMRLKTDAGW